MLIGAAMIGIVLPFVPTVWPQDLRSWLLLVALALVSTFMPFWTWNAAQRYLPLSVISVSAYFAPVVAMALGVLLLGESVTGLQWSCGERRFSGIISNMRHFVFILCALLAQLTALGFERPTAYKLVLSENETYALKDSDTAWFSNLTEIVMGQGSSITGTSLTQKFPIKAEITGQGTFSFTDCLQGVELTCDSSEHLGHFEFNNTVVTVASRYALGGSNSQPTIFTKGTSGLFQFVGSGLTNDAPLTLYGKEIYFPANDTAGAVMVQNGDFIYDVKVSSGGILWLRDIYFTGGRCAPTNNVGYYNIYTPDNARTVRFGENSSYSFGNWTYLRRGKFRFDTTPAGYFAKIQFPSEYADFIIGKEQALDSGVSWNVSFGTGEYGLDLNGFNQTVKQISGSWYDEKGYTPYRGQTSKYVVKSETPATLTIKNSAYGEYNHLPFRFVGQASFEYAGSETIQLVNMTSDTTGGMTVSSGTVLMTWDYGWNGTNVIVRSGATLDVDTPNAITSGKAKLVVEAGGTLNIHDNGLTVARAIFGGQSVSGDNIYSADQLRKLYPSVNIVGDGSIAVLPAEEKEFSWPTEPGVIAEIPMGKAVTVTDDDLSKLATLGGIRMKSGAILSFESLTGSWDLAVPISGRGTVKVTDCESYVITANNTNFLGHFEFVNSGVIVSNRFALGCVASETTSFTTGTKGTFRFMGGGLTNDAPLSVSSNITIPYDTTETLVLYGGLTIQPRTEGYFTFYPNNLYMAGGILRSANRGREIYLTVQRDRTLTIGPNSGINMAGTYVNCSSTPGHYVIASTNCTYSYFYYYNERVDIRFGAKDAFGGKDFGVYLSSYGTYADHGIDLGGYDQAFVNLRNVNAAVTKSDGKSVTITSDTAATLSVTGTTSYVMPLKFRNKASFRCAIGPKVTYTLVNTYSDTSGQLLVESGTLDCKWGYGWYGPDVRVTGGLLKIETDAKADFFNSDKTEGKSHTSLNISGEGKVELGANIATRVGFLTVDGTVMDRGTYGGTSCTKVDANHRLACFTGTGTVTVERGGKDAIIVIFD